jgi:hypothetical protein
MTVTHLPDGKAIEVILALSDHHRGAVFRGSLPCSAHFWPPTDCRVATVDDGPRKSA